MNKVKPKIVNSKTNKDGSRTITYDDNSFKTILKDKTIRSGGPIFDNNKKIISKKFEDGGDVKKDGKSRFIMPNADYDLNDPNFMRFIKRKMKKESITEQEAIDSFKRDVIKHNKAKGNAGFKKGGMVKKRVKSSSKKSRGTGAAIRGTKFKGVF